MPAPPPFDFPALEQLWLASIEDALTALQLPAGERLYALAFWLFYAETGSVIHAPVVGVAGEDAWAQTRAGEARDAGFGSLRWNPADWRYSMLTLPAQAAIDQAYVQLATAACGGIDPEAARRLPDDDARDAAWDAVFERGIASVIAVCHELTRRAHARAGVFAALPLTDDFVAVVCDPAWGDDGERWLRACIDDAQLRARLFPDL